MLSEEKENQLKGENLETLDENDRNEHASISSKIIIMYYTLRDKLGDTDFKYLTEYYQNIIEQFLNVNVTQEAGKMSLITEVIFALLNQI